MVSPSRRPLLLRFPRLRLTTSPFNPAIPVVPFTRIAVSASLKAGCYTPFGAAHFYVVDRTFKTGQLIPASGIYRIVHRQHRLPHIVTLLKNETFPRCIKCGNLVEFELVLAAEHYRNTEAGVRLYALPDLDDEKQTKPLTFGLPR